MTSAHTQQTTAGARWRIAVVGRGRLGLALGAAARRGRHDVTLLRRPGAPAKADSPLPEEVLDSRLDWSRFDLVLLAFETRLTSAAELARDEALGQLTRIPVTTPIGSVVMTPSTGIVDALLEEHAIAHFLTTPAAHQPGAIALIPRAAPAANAVKRALPDLHWIDTEPEDHLRLAVLMVGSGIAAAALAYLARVRGGELTASEADFLQLVLDDAKRILRLHDGDGLRAFSSVATPGGFTEGIHNAIFAAKWPPES